MCHYNCHLAINIYILERFIRKVIYNVSNRIRRQKCPAFVFTIWSVTAVYQYVRLKTVMFCLFYFSLGVCLIDIGLGVGSHCKYVTLRYGVFHLSLTDAVGGLFLWCFRPSSSNGFGTARLNWLSACCSCTYNKSFFPRIIKTLNTPKCLPFSMISPISSKLPV